MSWTNQRSTFRWVSAFTAFAATLALSMIFLNSNIRQRRQAGLQAALIATSLNGDAGRMKLLLAAGANAENPACDGPPCVTPLVAAALSGRSDAVSVLLDYGADVNGKSKRGQTALIVAAYKGYANSVKLLLARGADPHAQWDSYTALEFAKQQGHREVIELLEKAPAIK